MPLTFEPFVVPAGSTATLAALVRAALATSHSRAKTLIESGRVRVDETPQDDPASRPRGGARVDLAPAGTPRPRRAIVGPGFRVVTLDELYVVVDKESGIVTVPTAKEQPQDPPLVARVIAALGVAGINVTRGLWVVHRIDRGTSGLVLFARTERASDALREQFRERTALREYDAWTEGIPEPDEGTLHHWLRENEQTHRMFVTRNETEDAREAELGYVVTAKTTEPEPRARVRVRLVSGRRNQVRVQFSYAGWPLLGDPFYGAEDERPGRVALHAARLGFAHPVTGEPVVYESPWPRDLVRLDRRLFGYRPPRRDRG